MRKIPPWRNWTNHLRRIWMPQFLVIYTDSKKLWVVTSCWKQDATMLLGQHCSWFQQYRTILLTTLNNAEQCRTILLTTLNNVAWTTFLHPVSTGFDFWLCIEEWFHSHRIFVCCEIDVICFAFVDTSIGLLQMHIKELKEENNFLKDSGKHMTLYKHM